MSLCEIQSTPHPRIIYCILNTMGNFILLLFFILQKLSNLYFWRDGDQSVLFGSLEGTLKQNLIKIVAGDFWKIVILYFYFIFFMRARRHLKL